MSAPSVQAVAPVQPVASPHKFELMSGHVQFSVEISNPKLHSKWINEYRGVFNQQKKAYVFLLEYLADVEKAMGLLPGGSGLRNPKHYFPAKLQLDLYSPEGVEPLIKALAALGITYKKQSKIFEGSVTNIDKILPYVAK